MFYFAFHWHAHIVTFPLMKLKYRCLILDHDDTAVDSTAKIHYPAHREVLRVLRPHRIPLSLDQWFLKNFDPGIMEYLTGELELNDQEIQTEYTIWKNFTARITPRFYPGFLDALKEYRKRGGLIAVVSHSEKGIIERDYLAVDKNGRFLPDVVFGWDNDKTKRKPNPYPVQEILKTFRLKPSDALIVDDLKPGVLMAKATSVPVAAAGWAHRIPEIQEYMRENCLAFFENVEDFVNFILS